MVYYIYAVGSSNTDILEHSIISFPPPYSKASKQTIELLEATDPEYRVRPQAGLPWDFSGPEYSCWPPQVLGGPREGEMASKLRGGAPSTWPPSGAGRRVSTEVEEHQNLNKRKIHISAHVQSTSSSGWNGGVDTVRLSH